MLYCVWDKRKKKWINFHHRYKAIDKAWDLNSSAETIKGKRVIFSSSDKKFLKNIQVPEPDIEELRKHLDFLDLDRSI